MTCLYGASVMSIAVYFSDKNDHEAVQQFDCCNVLRQIFISRPSDWPTHWLFYQFN